MRDKSSRSCSQTPRAVIKKTEKTNDGNATERTLKNSSRPRGVILGFFSFLSFFKILRANALWFFIRTISFIKIIGIDKLKYPVDLLLITARKIFLKSFYLFPHVLVIIDHYYYYSYYSLNASIIIKSYLNKILQKDSTDNIFFCIEEFLLYINIYMYVCVCVCVLKKIMLVIIMLKILSNCEILKKYSLDFSRIQSKIAVEWM